MESRKSNFIENGSLLLIFFYIILTLVITNQYLIVPNYEVIKNEFGINDILVGLISTSYLLAFTFSILLWGYYTDKFDRKKLLVLGMIIWALFSLITFLSTEYWQLIIAQIGTAIGGSACYPVGFSMICDIKKPEDRASSFAWWSIALAAGSGLGVIIGGIIVNWRIPFLYLMFSNIPLILIILILKEPKRAISEFKIEEATQIEIISYNYRIERSDIQKLLKKKSIFYLILQGFPSAIPTGIISYWVITLYIREYNMLKDTASYASIIIFLGMLFGPFIFGSMGDKKFLKDNQARVKICIWTAAFNIPLWLLVFLFSFNTPPNSTIIDVIFIPQAAFMFIMGILASAVTEGSIPNKLATIGDITLPEHRGTIMAMYNFSINLGVAIGPLIGGIFSFFLGDNLRFAILFGFLFWVPTILLWIYINKVVLETIQEVTETLSKRAKNFQK